MNARRNAVMLQMDCCKREVRAKTLEELEARVVRHERNCPAAISTVVRARQREEVAP